MHEIIAALAKTSPFVWRDDDAGHYACVLCYAGWYAAWISGGSTVDLLNPANHQPDCHWRRAHEYLAAHPTPYD